MGVWAWPKHRDQRDSKSVSFRGKGKKKRKASKAGASCPIHLWVNNSVGFADLSWHQPQELELAKPVYFRPLQGSVFFLVWIGSGNCLGEERERTSLKMNCQCSRVTGVGPVPMMLLPCSHQCQWVWYSINCMARTCESVTDTSIYWPYSLRENHSKDNSEDNTKDLYVSSGRLLLLRCFRFYIGRYLYQKKMHVITRSTVCSLCCTFEIYKEQVPGTYCKTGPVRYRLVMHRNHSLLVLSSLWAGWMPPTLSPAG